MINLLSNLSIKRKLLFVSMFTSLLTLLLAYSATIYYDVSSSKKMLLNEVRLLSNVISQRIDLSITFNQKDTAKKHLLDLKTKKSVQISCVATSENELFASYIRKGSHGSCPEKLPVLDLSTKEQYDFSFDYFEYYRQIGEGSGILYIRSDLDDLYTQITQSTMSAAIFLLVVGIIVVFITSKLQRIIIDPINSLVKASELVGKNQYDTRVSPTTTDEIGVLAHAFNDMLSQIHKRDLELKEYSETLEDKVEERTKELETSKMQLEDSYKELEVTLERLRVALNKEKHFVNKMSHEIRTPIHQVVFNLSSLIMGWTKNTESERVEMVGTSLYATQRLQRLLESVLDFEKAREGKRTYYIRKCSVETMLKDVSEELHHDMAVKEIIFNLIVPHEMPQIICDMTKIEQVIRNILSNAIKYSDEGTIIVQAKEVSYQDEKAVTISVSDTGVGIPEDEIERIFKPFVESSRTETREKGTGLGLAICQEIIDAHRGEITVRNNFDVGSTFAFTIPMEQEEGGIFKWSDAGQVNDVSVDDMVKKAQEMLEGLVIEAEKLDMKKPAPLTLSPLEQNKDKLIVVADDDMGNLRPLEKILQKSGYKVKAFKDGEPAWEFISSHANMIYMCFLDNMMPQMYGIDVVRHMRADERTQHIPVVIQSGAIEEKELPENTIWMRKPYNPDDVIAAAEHNYVSPLDIARKLEAERLEQERQDAIEAISTAKVENRKHIVYADDDEQTLKMMAKMIEREGYEVHSFTDGASALEYIIDHKGEVGIALLDQNMPGMKGSEVAAKMLEDENLKNIPIVLQTGDNDDALDAEILARVNKLSKPYLPPDVTRKVKELMG